MNSDPVVRYRKLIDALKAGDPKAESCLRETLLAMAFELPTPLLLELSETILRYRRGELARDAPMN